MTDNQPPRDHAIGDNSETADETGRSAFEETIKSRSTWLRLVFMVILAVLYGLSRFVVGAVVILQFLWLLFTGKPNARLTEFGQSLATWTYQVLRYLTFNTESRPFPFDEDWPSPTAGPGE